MESLAILVLLGCGGVFCWALQRQWAQAFEQIKILQRIENIVLLVCAKPKYQQEFSKVGETNDMLCQKMLEIVEASEEHKREKSKLSEKQKVIAVISEERGAVEAMVEKMAKLGKPA